MKGRITTIVRGSHVDINVRLLSWMRYVNYTVLFLTAFGLVVMGESILATVASGRMEQILQQQRDAQHGCARYDNAMQVGACMIDARKDGR